MFSDYQQIFQPNIYDDGIYLYEDLNVPKKRMPAITIPTNAQSPYKTIPSYRNNIEMSFSKNSNGTKDSFRSTRGTNGTQFGDFNGHFSMPIRSGDPNRKTISDIYSATSWDERPQAFDGNNVYNDWINSRDSFSNFENSNSNANNSNILLKILLFIILIVLIVILCMISNNYHQKTNSIDKMKYAAYK